MPEMNMGVVLLIVLAIGAVFGLLNGLIIAFLNVPPFIATLGTQTIIYGISLVFTDAQPIGGFQESYNNLINGCIGDPKRLLSAISAVCRGHLRSVLLVPL